MITIGLTLVTLLQMERDEILSYMNHSKPGVVSWSSGLVARLVAYGLVPVVSLLVAQFPELRKLVFFWIEPLLHAVK